MTMTADPAAPPAPAGPGIIDQAPGPVLPGLGGDLGPGTGPAPADLFAPAAAAAPDWLTMYDAAVPPARPPTTDAVLIYAGGLTPHPWTLAEVHVQPARYRLPCWVADQFGQAAGIREAEDLLAWLSWHKAPLGRLVACDLETRKGPADVEYVTGFTGRMAAGEYVTCLYGSQSTLFGHPVPAGGWFVADPPPPGVAPHPHMFDHPHANLTQWRFSLPDQPWDLSVIRHQIRHLLWDTRWAGEVWQMVRRAAQESDQAAALVHDYVR